jgi:hypothetical protein
LEWLTERTTVTTKNNASGTYLSLCQVHNNHSIKAKPNSIPRIIIVMLVNPLHTQGFSAFKVNTGFNLRGFEKCLSNSWDCCAPLKSSLYSLILVQCGHLQIYYGRSSRFAMQMEPSLRENVKYETLPVQDRITPQARAGNPVETSRHC